MWIANDHAKCVDEIKGGTIVSFTLSNPIFGRCKINTVVTNSITSKRLAWDKLAYKGTKQNTSLTKGK